MSSKIYIYSTLSNDQLYTNYAVSDANGVALPTAEIFIAGQANIMSKNFITPVGVVTTITEEQLAELKTNEVFNIHVKNGFITISDKKVDVDVAAADMEGRDQSAPLVEQDLMEEEKPKTNKKG